MLSVDPALHASPVVASADWRMVQLPRLQAPPLRFKGRQRYNWERPGCFVSVWERKRGGLALSYSALVESEICAQAVVADTLAGLADHLESLCAAPWDEPSDVAMPGLSLSGMMRQMQYQHHFPLLVGDVLASLDPHLERPIDREPKGQRHEH